MGHRRRVGRTGKTTATAEPPSREALYARVWEEPLADVAADLGLSRTGLAKLCARLGVPCPPRGYWARRRRGDAEPPPGLPATPDAPRRRLDPEDRRAQILDVAAGLIGREGVHAASLKRIAGDAGVSEALVQSYFPRQADVLVELARRELETLRLAQAAEIEGGSTAAERLARSTTAYLRHVERRGALLQLLLGNPAVREGLRSERDASRAVRGRAVAERFSRDSGVDPDIALCATTILTAVCLRAGRLLARGRIDLAQAEALSQAMVRQGNRRIARLSRGRSPA